MVNVLAFTIPHKEGDAVATVLKLTWGWYVQVKLRGAVWFVRQFDKETAYPDIQSVIQREVKDAWDLVEEGWAY